MGCMFALLLVARHLRGRGEAGSKQCRYSTLLSRRYKKGVVILYDVRTGATLHRLHGHQDEVTSLFQC